MSTVKKQIVPITVAGKGTGVVQQITVGGTSNHHEFRTDTYTAFGGQDASPSPLSYVLGALTGCNQITAQLVAKDLGVELGTFRASAVGDLDPSVLAGGAEGNANFDRVVFEVEVETDADDEQFARLQAETERRCPVTQLYVRSGLEYVTSWTRVPLPVGAEA